MRILLLILAGVSLTSPAITSAGIVQMRSPQGHVERLDAQDAKYTSHWRYHLPNAQYDMHPDACRAVANGLDNVEIKLELQMMITRLNRMTRPRALSSHQEATLQEIPFCQQYATALMVISHLLQGYNLIKKSEAAEL